MLDRLVHRGPDDEGEVEVNGSWLGHRRLSIVDVEGGHQPLVSPDRELWLVGNGEVYNHEEVRGELADKPYSTRSDNEVALHLLGELGPGALGRLEGMFAFLAASGDGTFLAARDPVGIKPLYWARRDGHTRFASEMAAFDPEWLPHVEVFPPGHYWTPDGGLVRFARAVPSDAREPDEPTGGHEDELRDTRETLIRCVQVQMMGDVPVGVFLSGGLDSSLIAAIAARYLAERGETLQTFAVGTEDSSDLLAAREVAAFIGSEHRECVYTSEQAHDALPDVVRALEHFDPSLVRSSVANFFLARMTARHVKVVLTGEGADELFAGYEYYHDIEHSHDLHDELVLTLEALHNLNLQRTDRVTMAFGLEARVPFLDREMIALALRIHPERKQPDESQMEKQFLREAFEGWLPDEFLWRVKEQFGDGSGAASVLTDDLEDEISQEEFERERHAVDPPLRTFEELAYYRIFAEHLPGVRVEKTLGRFAMT